MNLVEPKTFSHNVQLTDQELILQDLEMRSEQLKKRNSTIRAFGINNIFQERIINIGKVSAGCWIVLGAFEFSVLCMRYLNQE